MGVEPANVQCFKHGWSWVAWLGWVDEHGGEQVPVGESEVPVEESQSEDTEDRADPRGEVIDKVIYGDNTAAIAVLCSPDGPWRTRHLRLRSQVLREWLKCRPDWLEDPTPTRKSTTSSRSNKGGQNKVCASAIFRWCMTKVQYPIDFEKMASSLLYHPFSMYHALQPPKGPKTLRTAMSKVKSHFNPPTTLIISAGVGSTL